MKRMTTTEMREYNQKQIFDLVYTEKRISRQGIAKRLDFSLPTILENCKLLEEKCLIEQNGLFRSTGGRKSVAYACVGNARIAIGSQISKHSIGIVAIDIYGEIIKRQKIDLAYENSEKYCRQFGACIWEFVKSLRLSEKRILGVGIAIQGLLSKDHTIVEQGIRLGSAGATLAQFARWIDYPCHLAHDSDAAALAEIWFSPNISNALYISLNYDLGGALIMNGQVYQGKENRGGLIEHLTLFPDGRECYCGNKGCLSSYCSARLLLGKETPTYEKFFAALRAGNSDAIGQWDDYLSNLALAIGSLHMILDCNIILGGSVGTYLIQEDVLRLQRSVRNQSHFSPVSDFLAIGRSEIDIFSCGAALPYIQKFLADIF